jgi:hypothetical protein
LDDDDDDNDGGGDDKIMIETSPDVSQQVEAFLALECEI